MRVGWRVLGPPSYLFFQMAFAAVSILRVFQLLSSCQVALRKLGAAFIECRDPGLTLEVGGKSGAASKHFDTVAAAELLVAGNYKDKIYHIQDIPLPPSTHWWASAGTWQPLRNTP